MSRILVETKKEVARFPRPRGDEPQFMEAEEYIRTFSPPTRG